MKFLSAAAAAAAVAFDRRTASAFQAVPRAFTYPGRGATATRLRWPWSRPSQSSAVSLIRCRTAATPVSCALPISDAVATPETAEAIKCKGGRHVGHGGTSQVDHKSFVQSHMRRAAMKLHTRDQAPKEGQQENKGVAFSDWKVTRRGYLQFLVDSKIVCAALEDTVMSDPRLSDFLNTGLERTQALTSDIAWMIEMYPDTTARGGERERGGKTNKGEVLSPTENALEYADFLRRTADSSLPAFICHFYNHYFAQTAGGRMIGRKVTNSCLDGRTIEFYKWKGNVKELLEAVRMKIDRMARSWSAAEKEACVQETGRAFEYGSRLLQSIAS